MNSSKVRRHLVGAVVIALVWMTASLAVADDYDGNQDEVDRLQAQLEELEAQTDEDLASDEFETALGWLEEAEQLIESGAERGVEQRVRRVDHQLDLLRALVDIRELERSIEEQHDAYEMSVQQVEELEEEIESLEERKAERQQELEQIREEL